MTTFASSHPTKSGPRALRALLGAILLGFLLLVIGSVTATFMAVQAQANDARLINLAGRQRMLAEKMIWLSQAQPDSPDLAASIQLFDQTLRALRDGGPSLDLTGQVVLLPPAPDPDMRARLDEAAQTWGTFRLRLQPPDAAALQAAEPLLLAQLDSIVSELEARSQAKLVRLRYIQLAFLAAALLLLGWGYLVSRRHIAQPLAVLGLAAQRMAAGQLSKPLPPLGNDELGELGRAFEAMRVEIAAAHDQLETRVAQRTRELALAFEFSQQVAAQLDLEHLPRAVTERARALTQAKAAALCLLDETGHSLILCAADDAAAETTYTNLRQALGNDPAGQVVCTGQTVLTGVECSTCAFLRAHAPGQSIVAPLRTGESTLGALCVVRGENEPFDLDETRALSLLANSAAGAIALARLAQAGKRQAEQTATLVERERIAAELHDHIAQTLGFLNLKAGQAQELLAGGHPTQAAGELEHIRMAVGAMYEQVRAVLADLREPQPAASELAERLAACLDEFRRTSGLDAELSIADPSALMLAPMAQTQIVRIVREALTNVKRHARARRVCVRVAQANGEACFLIQDDGCGFDPLAVEGESHLGLMIMQTRARQCRGRLSIDSAPGAGTRIAIYMPLTTTAEGPSSRP